MRERSSILTMVQKEGLLSSTYNEAFRQILGVVERDVVPDFLVRKGIRYLLRKRASTVRCSCMNCGHLSK